MPGRPPFVLVAHVRSVDRYRGGGPTIIDYALLDEKGPPVAEVKGPLDSSWWANFKPLVRRYG